MMFSETPLPGAYIVDIEPARDSRGLFARVFCRDEMALRGLAADLAQCSTSFNEKAGTLRGMHFQAEPHAEEKLVRCTAGAIFDAIVDIRPGSRTFRRWFGLELSAENRRALYVPKGFAHGFLTLAEASEVLYMISVPYAPGSARGFRWDDPAIGIEWPRSPQVIAERDAAYPFLVNAI